MDSQTQLKIEKAVLEILKVSNMEETTEYKVRSMAAEKLGIDLSVPDRKRFVRRVVESFLQSMKESEANQEEQEQEPESEPAEQEQEQERGEQQQEEKEEEEEEEEEYGEKKNRVREYDDEGDLIICRLSNKRKVTVQDFRGKTLVSIREYYERDGKEMPSSKGISLTAEQWEAFSKSVPKIEDAIKKLQGED